MELGSSKLPIQTFLRTSPSEVEGHSNGPLPFIIEYKQQPSDQRSTFLPYGWWFSISGDMQFGVPQRVFLSSSQSLSYTASPKSAIFF